jgi:arylsulfotransferase ASST
MLRDTRRRLAMLATLAFMIAGLLDGGAAAEAAPPSERANFSVASLFPSYTPQIHDYVVRCNDAPVTVKAHTSGVWRMAIGNGPFRRGNFSQTVPLGAGLAFTVTARQAGRPERYHYHVRCLPSDFPKFTFTRYGPASPKYFTVENVVSRPEHRYAIIFNNNGVPIWWYKAPTHDAKVLANGTILWFAYPGSQFEIHRLDGSLVDTLNAVGFSANDHDVQLLANGDHLVGGYVSQDHVDTSAYGGSSDATVRNAELQQVTPDGQLVWDWKSQDHTSLGETGRWWPYAIDHAYDITHWNAIEPNGGSVIASFRNLDAIYKIDKSTGNIVWKLGGTTTAKSLTVLNDPHSHPLGGQHDVRLLADGTVTLFDNRSYLEPDATPEAVRFRIDEQAGTATLLQSITDPAVHTSNCCGSARRLGNGDWLISWGGLGNLIGGYKSNGQRTFILKMTSNRTYRAQPVPAGVLSPQDLRQGMDVIYGAGPP